MSEYVTFDQLREELHKKPDLVKVVRCRDCKWSAVHDGKSWPGNKHKQYVGKMYCIAWSDGFQGEWTKPDGYCHRACRKEGGE